MAREPLQHFPAAMSLQLRRKIAASARRTPRVANKRLNYRVFVVSGDVWRRRSSAAGKIFARRPQSSGIEVAFVAIALTCCHKCDFFARLECLALKIARWHRHFYAVPRCCHPVTSKRI
jgi:Fe-S oxidoreductase